ncbi:nucleoporin, WD repeat Nup132 [Schizosaccharomyces osmophilus]|uniref:Nucleoporin, WD repeat Nup132 n=1 Tax=Schizosaccharomyces osmophilus TaxID=2545709 RepID=A0AAE9WAH3_9SCHI|nr:nucleoporin, WD repeat Nup132 [Schizosaccharomyces osmophilus]WBW72701.1 nucleoporin, WD repeat Nup132 [Schizosaccharomyces osmophilus]
MSTVLGKRKNVNSSAFDQSKRISVETRPYENGIASLYPDWLKGDYYHVFPLLKRLHSDISNDLSLTGTCYPDLGYVLLNSKNACYVFSYQHSQTLKDPPTITFPLPEESDADAPELNPLTAIVSSDIPDRDPGLLILMPVSGRIAYWTCIGNALAQPIVKPQGMESQFKLSSNEYCLRLYCANPFLYIVSTNYGRLLSISLRDSSGLPKICLNTVASHGGLLSKCLEKLRIKNPFASYAVSIMSPPLSSSFRHLLYVTDSSGLVDIYNLKDETMHVRVDLTPTFLKVLEEAEMIPEDFLFLDSAITSQDGDSITFLCSWKYGLRYKYSLYTCDFSNIANPHLMFVHSLGYTSSKKQRLKIQYASFGPCFILVSPSAVIILNTRMDLDYNTMYCYREDVIRFKSDISGGIIASGCKQLSLGIKSSHANPKLSCLVVTSKTGVTEIEIQDDAQQLDAVESLKRKIEEAVFYGYVYENPLDFSWKTIPKLKVSEIERLIYSIGKEILTSSSSHLPPVLPSLIQHLDLRLTYLNNLVRYVKDIPYDISDGLLFSLRILGEKCNAARSLWATIDLEMSTASRSLIFQRIIFKLGKETQLDKSVRNWFMQSIDNIEQLIMQAHNFCVDSASRVQELPIEVMNVILESNEIILAILSSALSYRVETHGIYDISADSFEKEVPWTSTPDVLTALTRQFELTKSALFQFQQGERDSGKELLSKDKDVVRNALSNMQVQLVVLTEVCFNAYAERLGWLSENESDRIHEKELEEAFTMNRKFWIQTLFEIGQGKNALRVAEKYRDYRSVVELCYQFFAKKELDKQIDGYLLKFGKEFAFVLYDFYVEKGMSVELLNSDKHKSNFLTEYFTYRGYNEVSWMHDMRDKNYELASHRLLQLANKKENLVEKKEIELSLGKIFLYANPKGPAKSKDLVLVEQKLEQIHIQKMIEKTIMPVVHRLQLQGKKYHLVEATIEEITDGKPIPVLARQVMHRVIKCLIDHQVIAVTELIEYLSFSLYRKNELQMDDMTDYYFALRLLLTTRLTDEAKRFFEDTIWRRAVLNDKWSQILDTKDKNDAAVEAEVRMTALYQTLRLTTINGLFQEGLTKPTSLSSFAFDKNTYGSIAMIYSPAKFGDTQEVIKVLNRESHLLKHYLEKTSLNTWFVSMSLSCDSF